jgi:hypothetical protein
LCILFICYRNALREVFGSVWLARDSDTEGPIFAMVG